MTIRKRAIGGKQRAALVMAAAAARGMKRGFRTPSPRKQKQRMKMFGSRTLTNTYTKKRKTEDVNRESAGLFRKNLGVIRLSKKAAKHQKLLGTYHYRNINQWVINGAQGHQVTDFAEVLLTRDMLLGLNLSSDRTERYRWADNPFYLNPYNDVPTSTSIHTLPQVGISPSDLLYVKSAKCVTHLLNMTKLPMDVTVYFCTPRHDTDADPITAWTNVLNSKSNQQIPQVGANIVTTPTSVAGQPLIIDYASNPYHHKEFHKIWPSAKTSHIVLQSGEQVDLHYEVMVEKILSRFTLLENRNAQFLKGLTIFPIFIVRCGLEGLSTIEGNPSSEVSYGAAKLGVVSNQQYVFGALPTSRISVARTYTGQVVSTSNFAKTLNDDEEIISATPNL